MKVYNQLFTYTLTPNALKVYIYLSCCRNALGYAAVRTRTIQGVCRIASAGTVQKAVGELSEKGLVTKSNRYNREGQYIANGYYVTSLAGKYFCVDSIKDKLALPKAAFQLYLYLKMRSRANGRAWPSIRQMARDLCSSCNTILAALHDLVSGRLLRKGMRWKGKHNLYIVFCKPAAKPNKKSNAARVPHCPTLTEKCTTIFPKNIIDRAGRIVKGVYTLIRDFFGDGCIKKWITVSRTNKSTQ